MPAQYFSYKLKMVYFGAIGNKYMFSTYLSEDTQQNIKDIPIRVSITDGFF